MRLILVRHGQTLSNVRGLLDTGVPGAGLTAAGHEQARALPAALAGEEVEVLVTSTLVRTQQTAAPLAAALGLQTRVRDEVREVRAGDLEMRGDTASVRTYLETVFAWPRGDLGVRMPGGEDGYEVLGRYDEVVAELAAAGASTAVVVSHGAVMRCWVAARARNCGLEHAAATPIANTGAVVVEGDPRTGWEVLTWEGRPLAGPHLDTSPADGPTGQPVRGL